MKKQEREEGKELPKKSYIDKELTICIIVITLAVVLKVMIDLHNRDCVSDKPKYWAIVDKDATLKHLYAVLHRIGYERTTNDTYWNLLWSWPYPFNTHHQQLANQLKPLQRVNHFPSTGHLTNKVTFSTTESKYMLKAFDLPKQKDEFLDYASKNKDAMFVEKLKTHRGISLKNVTDVDEGGEKFVQEYLRNPFLVDGYKFDIGVYTVITSLDPLRVYYYTGDVLFRYCTEKYHPLDPKNLKKYVIADDYQSTSKMKVLNTAFNDLGFGMKDSFDIYARSKGKDPSKIWLEVQNAIRDIVLKKEQLIVDFLNKNKYYSKHHFFELLRVDLIVDEDFNVYLLEANMSPNLVSPSPHNQLLYEQILYNTMSLVGLTVPQYNHPPEASMEDCEHGDVICMDKKAGSAMLSADKNIAVFGDECSSSCDNVCGGFCALCRHCLSPVMRTHLHRAYREHIHRGDFRRLFPPPLKPKVTLESLNLKNLTQMNRLMYMWYQGKCNNDASWCH